MKDSVREFGAGVFPPKFWNYNIHPITGWRINRYTASEVLAHRKRMKKYKIFSISFLFLLLF